MKKNNLFLQAGQIGMVTLFYLSAPVNESLSVLEKGKSAYRAGEFQQALQFFEMHLKDHPEDAEALRWKGTVALLMNDLTTAEIAFQKVIHRQPQHKKAKEDLALVYYRQNRFSEASTLLMEIGKTNRSAQLASFQNDPPYQISGSYTEVPFLPTDSLPIVTIRVNDSNPIEVLLDTGTTELGLDAELVENLGIQKFGAGEAIFAGGQKASFVYARAEKIELGDLTIRRVPIQLLSFKHISSIFPDHTIQGSIGTAFLYPFIPTIDYPAGRLILRRKTSAGELPLSPLEGSKVYIIPFFLAGDHFILTKGDVNGKSPGFYVIDTGLSEGGFVGTEQTLTEAGISIKEEEVKKGIGGAPVEPSLAVFPFTVDSLSLGGATEKNILGFFGLFPPSLEYAFGFRIHGLISHEFFKPYRVTLDFERMQLRLEKLVGVEKS